MDAIFVALDDRLQSLFHEFDIVLEGLPVAALDWVPGPGFNSLTVLATHAAGATRYWIGDVVAGDSSGRVRASEFQTSGVESAALRQQSAEVSAYCQKTVASLTLADLDRVCDTTMEPGKCTVAWALLHAVEHLAMHVGHAQITRQLWEQQSKRA
jgi:hypothetical protein